MDKKEESWLHVLVFVVLLLAIFHTLFHVFFFGTGVSGLISKGVSGFSIGDLNLAEETEVKAQTLSVPSRIIILVEWALLICLVVFSMFRTKIHVSPESNKVEHIARKPGMTDLDVLYEMLKNERSISMTKIKNTFGISKEMVESWCKILETGNLAEVHYPRLGEPELRLLKQ